MSNRALTWAFDQATGNAGRKAVLLALADMADDEHACWPKQPTLAAMTDQSERAVRGHLAALESLGLIARSHQYRDGRRASDRYVLAVDSVPADLAGIQPEESAGKQTGVPADLAGSSGRSRRYLKEEPSVNPKETPSVSQTREPKPAKATAAKRGSRLPADWVRSEQDKAWQHDVEKIPDEFAKIHTAQFKDYWVAKPGAGGLKLDWSATWRNWMRRAWHGREGDDFRRRTGTGPAAPVIDFAAQREAAAADRRRAKFNDPSQRSGLG